MLSTSKSVNGNHSLPRRNHEHSHKHSQEHSIDDWIGLGGFVRATNSQCRDRLGGQRDTRKLCPKKARNIAGHRSAHQPSTNSKKLRSGGDQSRFAQELPRKVQIRRPTTTAAVVGFLTEPAALFAVRLVGFPWLIAAHNDAIEKSGNKYPDAARHANSLSRNDTSLRVWINSKA